MVWRSIVFYLERWKMSRFYQTNDNVILNLDKILYVRKNGFCVDVIYGTNDYNVQYSFNNVVERNKFFDKLSKYLKVVTENDLR